MVFLLSSWLSQPDHWYYLIHFPFYSSTALQHSHFLIQLNRVFLLDYPALFVVEHIISPNPIVVFCFGTLKFSSIWCRSWQLVSCGRSQYLPTGSVCNPSHCFWIDVSQVCVFEMMSTLISWCLSCVQSSLRLPESCVRDNQSISFTKVNEHLTSVILSS